MVDLVEKTPCAGLLPVEAAGCRLSERLPGPMAIVAPFVGQADALDRALRAAHGVGFPKPGDVETAGEVRAVWFGRDAALLTGVVPDGALAAHALVSDQSDGWCVVSLDGARAAEVLARLVPVDLEGLETGQVVRSLLGHMSVAIIRHESGFEIMAFRSMAGTLVREIADAMAHVAGRHALG